MSIFVHRIPIDCIKLSHRFSSYSFLIRFHAHGLEVLQNIYIYIKSNHSIEMQWIESPKLLISLAKESNVFGLLQSMAKKKRAFAHNDNKQMQSSNYKWIDKVVKSDQIACSHTFSRWLIELSMVKSMLCNSMPVEMGYFSSSARNWCVSMSMVKAINTKKDITSFYIEKCICVLCALVHSRIKRTCMYKRNLCDRWAFARM